MSNGSQSGKANVVFFAVVGAVVVAIGLAGWYLWFPGSGKSANQESPIVVLDKRVKAVEQTANSHTAQIADIRTSVSALGQLASVHSQYLADIYAKANAQGAQQAEMGKTLNWLTDSAQKSEALGAKVDSLTTTIATAAAATKKVAALEKWQVATKAREDAKYRAKIKATHPEYAEYVIDALLRDGNWRAEDEADAALLSRLQGSVQRPELQPWQACVQNQVQEQANLKTQVKVIGEIQAAQGQKVGAVEGAIQGIRPYAHEHPCSWLGSKR